MSVFNDKHNILGVSELINNSKFTFDDSLEKLEQEIVDGAESLHDNNSVINTDAYEIELNDIMSKFNTEYDDNKSKDKIEPFDTINQYDADSESDVNEIETSYVKPYSIKDTHLKKMTNEEKRQNHINNVIDNFNENGIENIGDFSLEKEQEEDDKIILLEKIDMLKQILNDDDIDISRVPDVDTESNIKDIKTVLKILNLKNDRNRLSSLADEGILILAAGMEFLFNGERKYFGIQPDLRGWSDTVKIKLRSLQLETSDIVSSVVRKKNIGSGTRIAMHLLPSVFLCHRNNKRMTNVRTEKSKVNDVTYKNAISELNNIK